MAETLDPKIEQECRRPAFCRTPEGAVEMGVGLHSWLFQEEQISVKDESWASSRGHNFHAFCMPVQGTNTSGFGCGTTALGQSSGSPQLGYHGAETGIVDPMTLSANGKDHNVTRAHQLHP